MNLIKTFELETGGGTTQPDSGEGGAAVKSEQTTVNGNQPATASTSQKAGADFILPLMILVLLAVKWWFNCKRS
ncbi:hypothetical protein [Shewanella sp. LZH-2]|uniref:hypothetical protein n=1 Tax=Shewanella sp. LZH-2 TaxID=2806008 RepID=UPI00193D4193|nr:hypothetical protein [Shewanella sp. LZH-2]QRK80174.1 hypothetical protein JM642_03415 [Shewanella sp. LZH-2]